jgi:hypothetical protein
MQIEPFVSRMNAWVTSVSIRKWSARSVESGKFYKSLTLSLPVTKTLQFMYTIATMRAGPVGSKHLMVAVKILEEDAFVITAFFTGEVKGGEQIWPKE